MGGRAIRIRECHSSDQILTVDAANKRDISLACGAEYVIDFQTEGNIV